LHGWLGGIALEVQLCHASTAVTLCDQKTTRMPIWFHLQVHVVLADCIWWHLYWNASGCLSSLSCCDYRFGEKPWAMTAATASAFLLLMIRPSSCINRAKRLQSLLTWRHTNAVPLFEKIYCFAG